MHHTYKHMHHTCMYQPLTHTYKHMHHTFNSSYL